MTTRLTSTASSAAATVCTRRGPPPAVPFSAATPSANPPALVAAAAARGRHMSLRRSSTDTPPVRPATCMPSLGNRHTIADSEATQILC